MRCEPKRWKPSVGDIVEVHARDHVRNDHTTYEFYVWGKIREITKNDIIVLVWSAVNDDTVVSRDEGTAEWFAIVKKAIVVIRRMGYE